MVEFHCYLIILETNSIYYLLGGIVHGVLANFSWIGSNDSTTQYMVSYYINFNGRGNARYDIITLLKLKIEQ